MSLWPLSSAMAFSTFPRASPRLLPRLMSASGMWRPRSRHADAHVGKTGRYRGVRLVDGHAHAPYLEEFIKSGLRHCTGGGLYQTITAATKYLARERHHLIIAHGMRELVRTRSCCQIEIEHEIEGESLPDLGFMGHHAMMRVQGNAGDEHGIRHPALRIAAATRSACTVSWTS